MPAKQKRPHQVAVMAFHGVVPFDLSIPCEIFDRVAHARRHDAYQVRVCSESTTVKAGKFDMRIRDDLSSVAEADTIIVPGVSDLSAPVSGKLIDALQAAASNGARIASICSGAFILAASGLLDGLRATTHWAAAPELARRYPLVSVDADVLYVDSGRILTSAGAAAGLDLCLHMVRNDYGAAAAADAARLAVMPLERAGGQSQFIVHAPPGSPGSLQPLLHWLEQHLDQPLTLLDLAGQAATSTRTLSRHFREQLGTTPLQWLLQARVRRAQNILETSTLSIERVAAMAGFGSATSLREHFSRVVGTSPNAYRNNFGGSRNA